MMIPFFMQRTLISTTIHLAKISLAQVTNKQNGRTQNKKEKKKKKKKEEEKAQEKGMSQLCSQRYSASFSSPRSHSFYDSLSLSHNKNLHLSHVIITPIKPSSSTIFTLKSCKLLLPFMSPTVASPTIPLIQID